MEKKKCSVCENNCDKYKNFCNSCYYKSRSQTPGRKKSIALYNATKGKAAREKYLSKKNPNSVKREVVKKICVCGNSVVAKNMCRNCYQNNRNNLNWVYIPKVKKTLDFLKVDELVKKGSSIQMACKLLNIDTGFLYKNITPAQKEKLNSYKKKLTDNNDYF